MEPKEFPVLTFRRDQSFDTVETLHLNATGALQKAKTKSPEFRRVVCQPSVHYFQLQHNFGMTPTFHRGHVGTFECSLTMNQILVLTIMA